jgi:hypothetical protein
MTKISKSPERNTFQRKGYLSRMADEGRTPENDESVKAMVDYYANWETQTLAQEEDPAWAENNMEYDLRSTSWILDKVRASESYAQNLYAAMCNNDFQKNDFMPKLAGKTWSCSWRYAGGIIADMREQGDYIDWYCSGIRDSGYTDDKENWTDEQRQVYDNIYSKYVSESHVTDEICADLKSLGWEVVTSPDDSY